MSELGKCRSCGLRLTEDLPRKPGMSDWGICPNCGKEQWLGPSAAIRKLEAEINKAGPADSVGQTAYQPRNASGQFQSQKVDPGGYWLCPACGSKESFEGTTIIKEGSVSVIIYTRIIE